MQEQVDPNYRWRGWRVRVPLWLFTLFAFVGVARVLAGRSRGNWFWLVAFVLLSVCGLSYETWLKRSYRCPQCGKRLGPPRLIKHERSGEYVHDCPDCGVTWRTLTFVPDPGE